MSQVTQPNNKWQHRLQSNPGAALAKWIDDYDFSPRHTPAVLELIDILQQLAPSAGWDHIRDIVSKA